MRIPLLVQTIGTARSAAQGFIALLRAAARALKVAAAVVAAMLAALEGLG